MIRLLPVKHTDVKLIDYLTKDEVRALLGPQTAERRQVLRDRAMLHLYSSGEGRLFVMA